MVLWPMNLDGGKSRSVGRKLSASRAVRQPTIREIVQAATALGLSPEIAEKAATPSIHWEKLGSVTIKRSGTKQSTMKSIASEILKARQREAQATEQKRDKR
jgi:signal recognition particle subunit SEC65